jgi:methylated-DNA-protein-cysteine methyltransferase-like protein
LPQSESTYTRIYTFVRKIPSGKVATYGQIARMADCGARQVGYALAALKDDSVPWFRVINAKGRISLPRGKELQRALLEGEGVQFDESGRVDLKQFGWDPPVSN